MNIAIGLFCKNSRHNLADWLFGIRAQTRQPDRIFAIDGLSDDGTVEFLKKNKVEVFSEKDNSPQEAFFKMLKKNTSDIFICSLADEQLLPDAIKNACLIFEKNPDIDILTRDILVVDSESKQETIAKGRPFHLKSYMRTDFSPHFAASFFQQKAFQKINLWNHHWTPENIGEYELWFYAAKACHISYVPGIVSRYTNRGEFQLSSSPFSNLDVCKKRIQFVKKLKQKKLISIFEQYFYISGILKNSLGFVLGMIKKTKKRPSKNITFLINEIFNEARWFFNLRTLKYYFKLKKQLLQK